MNIQFANLQAQYQAYKSEINSAIQHVLDSANFIMGPEVGDLEEH